jgi:2-polyprenyl-3-methyl-5-hydroxy-6-metoxy-1,4-benzoquinol methylase
MNPAETGDRYDRIAQWWQTQHQESRYGLKALARAIRYAPNRQVAIDIGCGSSGRFIQVLLEQGFQVEGLDISAEMVKLARQLHPAIAFDQEDVCTWQPSKSYSLIVAWDSTFHLPLEMQAPVTGKLCNALAPNGVLMFTCGGGAGQSAIAGSFQGQDFEYSTLGVNRFLQILDVHQCTCLHLEYDQYPENHLYIIAQKLEM